MTDMTMRSSIRVKPASWCWRFVVVLMVGMFPRRSFSRWGGIPADFIQNFISSRVKRPMAPQGGVGHRLDEVLCESIINAMAQSLAFLLVHVIFSTKDREPFLDAAVRPELYAYLGAVARTVDASVSGLAVLRTIFILRLDCRAL